jgi:ectoine hydroxylase-related dioxygenase (phytanoyl-CoA dioxygenase family)
MKYAPEIWQQDYQANGFVVVQDLLDETTLSDLRAEFERITENVASLPPQLKEKIFFEWQHVKNNPQYYEGILTPEECGNSVRQIEDLALFDPTFAKLICYPPMLDVLEALFESLEFSFNYLIGRPKDARVGSGISDGHYHRDTPFEEFTAVNTILVILCLNDMTNDNGATSFIRGSHKVSDEEAKRQYWRDVAPDELDLAAEVVINCPAGSGIFFNTKTLHAAGHNRSDHPRHTIISEWVGANVLPTSPVRYPYHGLKPRSKDPAYAKQISMTFPALFAGKDSA